MNKKLLKLTPYWMFIFLEYWCNGHPNVFSINVWVEKHAISVHLSIYPRSQFMWYLRWEFLAIETYSHYQSKFKIIGWNHNLNRGSKNRLYDNFYLLALNLNFSPQNDLFWILVHLIMKWSELNLISTLTRNFGKNSKLNYLKISKFWAYYHDKLNF